MPIKGLSEQRRLPRIGKIRLGIKKISERTKQEYPSATDYFVCPPEVQDIYGKKPQELDVIIPLDDEEIWANQYYRQYSRSRGLVCKGDGLTCRRMVDTQTGTVAGRDTKTIIWQEGKTCEGRECPDYKSRACQEVMNLQFILPKVPGLGVWQIDTGSIHSIMNINNCATMIRASTANGSVAWIPLKLVLKPTEVINPDDGKKKTVYCMHLKYEKSLTSLLLDSEKPRIQVLLAKPVDDEAPEDRLLSAGTPEKLEELHGQNADNVDDLWPEDMKITQKPPQQEKDLVKPEPATEKAKAKLPGENKQDAPQGAPEGQRQASGQKQGETIIKGVNVADLWQLIKDKGWDKPSGWKNWIITNCKPVKLVAIDILADALEKMNQEQVDRFVKQVQGLP